MNKRHIASIFTIFILGLLTSCVSNEAYSEKLFNQTHIASLKNTLVITDPTARNWNQDAYLSDALIGFGLSDIDFVAVTYESPSSQNIGLSILTTGKSIIQEKVPVKMVETNKITNNDWTYDSPEILRIVFSQVEVIKFAKKHGGKICGSMFLSKTNNFRNHPFVWNVKVENCTNALELLKINIDPITGVSINE